MGIKANMFFEKTLQHMKYNVYTLFSLDNQQKRNWGDKLMKTNPMSNLNHTFVPGTEYFSPIAVTFNLYRELILRNVTPFRAHNIIKVHIILVLQLE